MTRTLLDSPLARRFEIVHLDTADRRGVANIGRLDVGNVWRAGIHALRFLTLLASGRFDLVYLPISKNALGFLRDALFIGPAVATGTPFVVHFHGAGFDEFVRSAPLPVRALVRLLLKRAARGIVPGHALEGMVHELIAEPHIVVIPNGVADPFGGTAVERTQGEAMHILFLGNLLPGKGYVELLDAAQALLDEGIDIRVTFAGSMVDSLVHERALATLRYGVDRIRFRGAVDADGRAAVLREADVLALPSEDEAHPLVILEAMAAALPVVSTRHGAIPETVTEDTGVLIETRDAAALTEALRALALDPGRRERLGAAGRRRYESRYTAEGWSESMGRMFDGVGRALAP
ncbi:MAG: glycosyltransferase family 4 protein [Gemmatimonadetes bacterium]|nr:glycosyltransferase family 4 protein [Gemmatimonadota bacterium]